LTARFEAARKALDAAHVVAAPSRYVRGTVSRALGRNGTGRVMPLGLEKQAGVTRDPANGAVRFTFMGQINRLKNLRVALDAIRRVSGLAELNVFGRRQDPREAERLERAALADARIRYHGPYGEKRLPEILAKTDVGIVPSLTESFSLVAREFLAAGIPVLAARTGGLPEAVANGVNGMLFDPGDASELAGLMRRCMDEAGFVERLAQGVMPILDAAGDAASWENIYQAGSA
jgi:glycosyltransferase involved in cell wall biosynthesis